MNVNIIRSVLTGLAGIIPMLVLFFGCKTDAITGTVSCVESWVPPQYAIFLGGAFGILSFILKMFSQGGTATENLTSPSVVVTPEVKVGTVTEDQVNKGA